MENLINRLIKSTLKEKDIENKIVLLKKAIEGLKLIQQKSYLEERGSSFFPNSSQ